ncbi:hypothetical protein IAT38_003743 [Cryptococcus sp. DSM 104549]
MAAQEGPNRPSPTTTLAGSVHELQGEAQPKEQDVTHEGQVDDIEKQLQAVAAPGPLAAFAAALEAPASAPNPDPDPAPAAAPAPTPGLLARTRDHLITRYSPAPTWSTGKAYHAPIWISLVVLLFAALLAFGIYSIYDVVTGGANNRSETAAGPS